jgi:hypothetical protein
MTSGARGYKSICVSMYLDDIAQLDAKVADLKARGYRRTSRAQLIRLALSLLDTRNVEPAEQVPTKVTMRKPTKADIVATVQAEPVQVEVLCACGTRFTTKSRTLKPTKCRACSLIVRHHRSVR